MNSPDQIENYRSDSSNKQLEPQKSDSNKMSQEERNSIKQEIVDSLRECAGRSSILPLPGLAAEGVHPSVIIMWVLIMATSWGYLIYQVYSAINLYNAFGVSSSVGVNFEAPTDFPAVDICNLNPYDNSYGDAPSIMNDTLLTNNISATSGKYDSILAYTDAANDQFKAKVESMANEQNPQELGFYLKDMLLSCYYRGKKCSLEDFYYYHDYYFGSCYRFNGGLRDKAQNGSHKHVPTAIKKISKPGWRNGLRMELYTGSQTRQQQFNYKAGFRIIIHNQTDVPIPDEDGVDVAVGLQSNIAVSRTYVYHQASPYSNCIDTLTQDTAKQNDYLQEMYNQIQSDIIAQYMQKYCMKLCYQYYIIDKCKCKSLSFTFLTLTNRNVSGCVNVTDLECMNTYDNMFYDSDQVNTCYSSCPIECSSVSYNLNTDVAAYPSDWYANRFVEYQTYFNLTYFYDDDSGSYSGPNYDLISKTTAMVNIFYDSMDYEVITESPILTFDLLLGNIGGNLGLFTGMSLLSCFELVEAAMTVGIIVFISKKTRIIRPNR